MNSSNFRTEARKRLKGKWRKAVCITLAYFVILFLLGFIEGLLPESMESIFYIVLTIINVPLAFGFIISFIKLYNNDEVKVFDFLSLGFSNFAKPWKISLQIFVKMLVPIFFIIVSLFILGFVILVLFGSLLGCGVLYYSSSVIHDFVVLSIIGFILFCVSTLWIIIKSYYYQLSYFVAVDNPDLSAKESVKKSKELMKNNRCKLFGLQLSFIGWSILAIITLGIGFLWLMPYFHFALIAFYKFLCGDNSGSEAEVVTENNDDPIQGE